MQVEVNESIEVDCSVRLIFALQGSSNVVRLRKIGTMELRKCRMGFDGNLFHGYCYGNYTV